MIVDEQRELLLKHSRHPSHAGDPSAHALQGSCRNPLCGDAVEIGVTLIGERVAGLAIRSSGCGISIAAASLMTEEVDGLSVNEALDKLEKFNSALTSSPSAKWPADISSLNLFSRLRESPTRVPCALIGWFALKDALKHMHLENEPASEIPDVGKSLAEK